MKIHDAGSHHFAESELSVFGSNMARPRHRWYEFKEGFSEELVRQAAEGFAPRRRRPLRVLDPFGGSGTTLVSAARLGYEGTSIEVNPFLDFAAKAKCTGRFRSKAPLQQRLDAILASSKIEIRSPLEGMSTFTPRPGLDKWLFNTSVIRGYEALSRQLRGTSRLNMPLRLALLAALAACCNAKRDGKCLRYRADWKTIGANSSDLRAVFTTNAGNVIDDLVADEIATGPLRAIQGDARAVLPTLDSDSFDLVVTSPPYLNSFDYSDVYRPELFAGGFVRSNAELHRIRLRTIRSHVQAAWTPAAEPSLSPMVEPLLEELTTRRLWSRRLPQMVHSYFVDMANVLRQCARLTRRGGQAWIVVSTSAYAGVEIPVDLILADVGGRVGWRVRAIFVLRNLRASGQHFKRHLEVGARPPLRESLLIFEKA
jgi:DNA modification methylase